MSSTIAADLERPIATVFDADLALVNASRTGDVSAFEELVKKYDRKLYRVAQGMIHNHEDAEEVVQTAFLKAYLNLHQFQGNAKFSTWLIRIAMNESFMKLRKRRSNKEQSLYAQLGFDAEESNHGQLDLTDWSGNPESLYVATELRKSLRIVCKNCSRP